MVVFDSEAGCSSSSAVGASLFLSGSVEEWFTGADAAMLLGHGALNLRLFLGFVLVAGVVTVTAPGVVPVVPAALLVPPGLSGLELLTLLPC